MILKCPRFGQFRANLTQFLPKSDIRGFICPWRGLKQNSHVESVFELCSLNYAFQVLEGIGFKLHNFGMDLFPLIFVNFKTPCLHVNSS